MDKSENKYKKACIILSAILVLLLCSMFMSWLIEHNFTGKVDTDKIDQLIKETDDKTNDTTTTYPKRDKNIYYYLPSHNHIYYPSDPPPVFVWEVHGNSFPDSFTVEIEYKEKELPITIVVEDATSCTLTEEQWELIKANAPMKNGQQIIYWRIIVDDPVNWTEEPDFMSKARFFIKYDE